MTDDEWELKRNRAILAAFQSGRPVFADSDGELRYVDGEADPIPDEIGVTQEALPKANAKRGWWAPLRRWFGDRS